MSLLYTKFGALLGYARDPEEEIPGSGSGSACRILLFGRFLTKAGQVKGYDKVSVGINESKQMPVHGICDTHGAAGKHANGKQ